MRVALCQLRSPETLAEGVDAHLRAVQHAAEERCDIALFPELSLTGYRTTESKNLAIDPASPSLDPLAALSMRCSIHITVGAPLSASNGDVEIGAVVFRPNGSRLPFAKHLLHPNEEPFFRPGRRCLSLKVRAHSLAFGICYEALQPEHGAAALQCGATCYVAMVAKHAEGMDDAHRYLSSFAESNGIPVLVVNAVGLSDGIECAGGSAGWDANGNCLRCLQHEEGILILDI